MHSSAPFSPSALSEVAARVAPLVPPDAHEKKHVLRNEAAVLLDRLVNRVCRSRGALDVAAGERLAALAVGDRALRLGYSGIGDYAREQLGMSGRAAQELARLARELRERPLLADVVRRGEVSARKAETILRVARGCEEAAWVERARVETVRALKLAVEAAAGAEPESDEDERWEAVWFGLNPSQRATVDEALALAGQVLGPAAPRRQRLEALCSEYLGAHAAAVGEAEGGVMRKPVSPGWLPAAKQALEEETRRWAFLDQLCPVERVAAPEGAVPDDPFALDRELRELVALRDGWDEVMGQLALLLQMLGLWRDMQFATFDQYCAERLGMATRTVQQRAWLARRLYFLPGLREAMRAGRLSYEQARLVAGVADDRTIATWIERAEGMTCIALRREIEAQEQAVGEAQMCARSALAVRMPRRVADLVSAAVRAVRETAGRWLPSDECLVRVAQHFLDTWKGAIEKPRTPQARAIARDRGFCQAPGCSRAAVHAHHLDYRSAGGGDELENLSALCAAHHLVGVHGGYLRMRGRAPDRLRWEGGLLG